MINTNYTGNIIDDVFYCNESTVIYSDIEIRKLKIQINEKQKGDSQ